MKTCVVAILTLSIIFLCSCNNQSPNTFPEEGKYYYISFPKGGSQSDFSFHGPRIPIKVLEARDDGWVKAIFYRNVTPQSRRKLDGNVVPRNVQKVYREDTGWINFAHVESATESGEFNFNVGK